MPLGSGIKDASRRSSPASDSQAGPAAPVDNKEGQLAPEPAESPGPSACKGGDGCHILCTEQLQAKPPAEAHRILHPGTETGEETSFHHTVRLGGLQPGCAPPPKTGGRRSGGQCLHWSSLEDLFSKGQVPSCF